MDTLSLLFSILSKPEHGIARVTISPALWQYATASIASESYLVSGFEDDERKRPAEQLRIADVPADIDELQSEPYRLWDAQGNQIDHQ